MTDKEKIREDVERLQKRAEHNFDISLTENERQFWLGESNALTLIGKYMDSMQEEPETKFKIGDRIRLKGTTVKGDVIKNIYNAEDGSIYFEFENSDDASADLDWELVEEPKKCMYTKDDFTEEDRKILCEDCEEECEYAKKEEPVSEELEDEIKKYCADVIPTRSSVITKAIISLCARHFAEWQKEQIMKGATEAIAKVDAGGYPYIPQIELYDYDKDVPLAKEGDKYKVILIKGN